MPEGEGGVWSIRAMGFFSKVGFPDLNSLEFEEGPIFYYHDQTQFGGDGKLGTKGATSGIIPVSQPFGIDFSVKLLSSNFVWDVMLYFLYIRYAIFMLSLITLIMAPLLLSQVVLVSNDQKVQLVSMSASKVKWGNRFTKPPHAPQNLTITSSRSSNDWSIYACIYTILLLETPCPLVRWSAQKYRIYRTLYLGNQKSYRRSAGITTTGFFRASHDGE